MKTINVKGPIISSSDQWIYDWFGIEATSPKSVNDAIVEANGDELEVVINSGGGDVFSGSEIYTSLKSYSGNVTTKIVGIAASAASVIAMAGNKVIMSPTAQFMIHNVSTVASGDYRDMNHAGEILKNANDTIANAYRIKSGMSQKDLLSLMDKETWMTAQQAKEKNLIDEVMFENQTQLVANYGNSTLLPPEVINKMRNNKLQEQPNTEINPAQKDEADILLLQKAKFQFLKLKNITI